MNICLWSSEDHLKSQTSTLRLCRIRCWYANMMFSLSLFLIMALKNKKKANKNQPITVHKGRNLLQVPADTQGVTASGSFPAAGILRCHTTRTKTSEQLSHFGQFYLFNTSFDIYFLMRNNTTETTLINHFHMVISLPQEPELQSNGNIQFSVITEQQRTIFSDFALNLRKFCQKIVKEFCICLCGRSCGLVCVTQIIPT